MEKFKPFDFVPSHEVTDQFYEQVADVPYKPNNDFEQIVTLSKEQQKQMAIRQTIFGDWNRKLTQEMFNYIRTPYMGAAKQAHE